MRSPIMPHIIIPGDNETQIMARSGQLVGWNDKEYIWRFGFHVGSDAAEAFGVGVDKFIWVIADWEGNFQSLYEGYGYDLPSNFQAILKGNKR